MDMSMNHSFMKQTSLATTPDRKYHFTYHTQMGPLHRFESLTARFGIQKKVPARAAKAVRSGTSSSRVIPKSDAVCAVKDIQASKQCELHLISCEEYERSHGKFRSNAYTGYCFLCFKNSTTCAGWLLCTYAINNGGCEVSNGLRRFDTSVGTSSILKHTHSHSKKTSVAFRDVVTIGVSLKSRMAESAGVATALGHLPISFTEKKVGMKLFAQTLLDIGKTVPADKIIKADDVLPCAAAVRNSIQKKACELRTSFRENHLERVMELGGGATSDGLKEKMSGRKFYDMVLHYFDFGKPHPLTGEVSIEMKSRVMFLMEHTEAETAVALRASFDTWLQEHHGVTLDEILQSFTFVTDCASTMPCIAGASSSSRRVPFTERWVGCIAHQLNTAMKKTIATEDDSNSIVSKDLKSLKTIVRIFKQSGMNNDMPNGMRMQQEVETRFATTFAVVKSFLSSHEAVHDVIENSSNDAAQRAFESLDKDLSSDGAARFPALNAIKEAFAPVAHMQKELESGIKPTLHLVLPMLLQVQRQLREISAGSRNFRTLSIPTAETRQLCHRLLIILSEIEIHNLWIAASLLHPGFRGLSFVNVSNREEYKTRGIGQIRRLMRKFQSVQEPEVQEVVPFVQGELGAESFDIGRAMDSVMDFGDSQREDEVTRYLSHSMTSALRDTVKADFGVVQFWYANAGIYPVLSKVAFRVLATPPSSSSSERDFSDVNRILSAARNCTGSNTVFDLVQIRTHYSNL